MLFTTLALTALLSTSVEANLSPAKQRKMVSDHVDRVFGKYDNNVQRAVGVFNKLAAKAPEASVETPSVRGGDAAFTTEGTNVPDVGYVEVEYYLDYYTNGNKCSGTTYRNWLLYGTCITSGQGQTSYMIGMPTTNSDGAYYSTVYDYGNSNQCQGTATTTYSPGAYYMNQCASGGVKLTGFPANYKPMTGGINTYSYNSNSACTAENGDYSGVIQAYYIPLDECISSSSFDDDDDDDDDDYGYAIQSFMYNTCKEYTGYYSTDCSKSAEWVKYKSSSNLFNDLTCTIDDDDSDDNYVAVAFTNYECSGAARTAVTMGLSALAAGLTLLALW